MFCPDCCVEYEEGVSVCADCEVALVDENADGPEDAAMEYSPLVESTDVLFFSLLTQRLEEASIPWFVQGEESLGLLPRDGRTGGAPGAQVAVVYVTNNRFAVARRLAESLAPVQTGAKG